MADLKDLRDTMNAGLKVALQARGFTAVPPEMRVSGEALLPNHKYLAFTIQGENAYGKGWVRVFNESTGEAHTAKLVATNDKVATPHLSN